MEHSSRDPRPIAASRPLRRVWLALAPVAAVLVLYLLGPGRPGAAQLTDLGTLGGTFSRARAINDHGQIVGEATTPEGDRQSPFHQHAFLWENGRMKDLGTLGGEWSIANDINNRGQVVGEAMTPEGHLHAFLWENGKMRDLHEMPEYPESVAYAIDDQGHVIGWAHGPRMTRDFAHGTPFVWKEGRMADLNRLLPVPAGCVLDQAWAVNAKGDMAGTMARADIDKRTASPQERMSHVWVWVDSRFIDIGDLGRPTGINGEGAVLLETLDKRVAIVWQDGKTRELRPLVRGEIGPVGINDRGDVVAWVDNGEQSCALLFSGGEVVELKGRSKGLLVPTDMNNQGQIVGSVMRLGHPARAFVLRAASVR
ncbi:MAG: hypothetical protein HY321_07140 [Armatimonadetes bacterium]|nr:hypothetical protein [Armatimonadota bacterium]